MKIFKRMKYIFDEDIEVTKAVAAEGVIYLLCLTLIFVSFAIFVKSIFF